MTSQWQVNEVTVTSQHDLPPIGLTIKDFRSALSDGFFFKLQNIQTNLSHKVIMMMTMMMMMMMMMMMAVVMMTTTMVMMM